MKALNIDNNDKILPIWQPVGHSTHIIATKIAQKIGVKTSHTGTLDPMAQGVIIILLDDYRTQKYELAKWLKTYTFDLVLGIETDTYDGMGLITNTDFDFELQQVGDVINNFNGKYTQTVPPYSAIKVKGKPLHYYARNNLLATIELPKRSGEIIKINLKNSKTISAQKYLEIIINNIKKVEGDFRQEQIIKCWKNTKMPQKINVLTIEVQMTKGLYVRSLAQDIANSLGNVGFANNIVRTKNGKYEKTMCIELKKFYQ